MYKLLILTAISLNLGGCTLKLPEIPQNHPANVGAPAGRMYATPAVLEVRPFVRPPDRPMTRPAHPYSHESEPMTPMGEMPGRHDVTEHENATMADPTATVPSPPDAGQRDRVEGNQQQQMQREGQLHE